ncbi:hypothetical protein P885DRAFT_44077 [Corynascus similis CBS 632.67]
MPTTHVDPGCDPLLQDIANTLWKSRKVVVITGAGISTNSGIPDFRSENGLYSLIQAQFDATQQQSIDINSEACPPDAIEQRPPKRQRRAYEDSGHERGQAFEDNGLPFPGLRNSQPRQNTEQMHAAENNPAPPSATRLSDPRADNHLNAEENTVGGGPCPSSPPSFALGTPHHRRAHLLETLPGSSSPLSSPPPITYDPYQETSSCSSDGDTESSRSQSEEPSSVTTPLLSSQTSISSRSSLPLMKGRDLFDAQIWSCPVKTSVFYTFVSTLREKVRCAEPTISHRFVGVLRDSRKLVRCYTQNIDQLEERVGLRTSLSLGPGSRYRFSARAGRNNGVTRNSTRGVDDPPASQGDSRKDEDQKPSRTQTDSDNTQDEATSSTPSASQPTAPASPNRGVECVFLHGSLAELRCFVCARTASWEEDTRLADTLAGRQPTCPHCAGATAAREERGKRALGVGKLRPDIVLYGEEHPHAHLISPLVQHDLSLGPDMLLILGTSLRVHGLKVLEAIIQSFPLSNAQPKNDFMSDGTSSISAAVKSRKRKQTVAWRMIGGVETRVSLDDAGKPQSPAASLPRPTTILQPSPVPDSRRLPLPTPTAPQPTPQYQTYHGHIPPSRSVGASPQASAIDMAINAGFRETDRLIAQIHHETLLSRPATPLQLHLPPLLVTNLQNQQRHQRVQSTNPGQQQHKHEDQQQHKAQCLFYSTTKLVPLEPKVDSPGPRQEISSNVGSPVGCGSGGASGPFFFSDPLSSWLGYPPVWLQQQQRHDHHHDDHHHRRRQEPILGPPQRQQQQQRMNYEKDGYSKRKVGLKCHRDMDQRSDAKWEPQREGEAGVSSPWCPDEQLWKEQEAALMLSTMRGTG